MTRRGIVPAVLLSIALLPVFATAQECILYDRSSGPEGFATRDERAPYGSCLAQYVDPRDGNEYLVRIRGVNKKLFPSESWSDTMMLENLRYRTANSECLYDARRCERAGRVYPFEELKEACPEGWEPKGPELREWTRSRYWPHDLVTDAVSVVGYGDWSWGKPYDPDPRNSSLYRSFPIFDEDGVKFVAEGGVDASRGENLFWMSDGRLFVGDGRFALGRRPLWAMFFSPSVFQFRDRRSGDGDVLFFRTNIRKASVRCGKGTHPPLSRDDENACWSTGDMISCGQICYAVCTGLPFSTATCRNCNPEVCPDFQWPKRDGGCI